MTSSKVVNINSESQPVRDEEEKKECFTILFEFIKKSNILINKVWNSRTFKKPGTLVSGIGNTRQKQLLNTHIESNR